MENSLALSYKVNKHTDYMIIYLREIKSYVHTKTYMQMFSAILLRSAETQEYHPDITWWIDKQIVIHLQNEILERNKRKQIINTCNMLLVDESQKQYVKWKTLFTKGYVYTVWFHSCNILKSKTKGTTRSLVASGWE